MTFTIRVTGATEKGAPSQTDYLMFFAKNVFEAMKKAIDYANEEYDVERDENGKRIPNSTYKQFATITSVVVLEDNILDKPYVKDQMSKFIANRFQKNNLKGF